MAEHSDRRGQRDTSPSQITKEELPFDVHAYEKEYGPIRTQEELCPGIYQIRNGPVPPWHFCTEYIVVLKNSPAISDEAKGYGTPSKEVPEILMYSTEDYFNKPRWVVTYEIHKYLVGQGIPLPDGESLAEDRVRGMEVCPEYFGEFPVPVETPWGPILQYDKLWNGIYWLETAEAGWALALAFPFFEDVRENTAALAVSAPSASEGGENSDFAYHFYPYKQSCLPLFELLPYAEETWAKQINVAALKNAILELFPDYARENAEEYAELPVGDQILFTSGAGTNFYKFPATALTMDMKF